MNTTGHFDESHWTTPITYIDVFWIRLDFRCAHHQCHLVYKIHVEFCLCTVINIKRFICELITRFK